MTQRPKGTISRRAFLAGAGAAAASTAAGPFVRRARAAAGDEIEQVTVGLVTDPSTMDPHMHVSRFTLDIHNQIYEQLVHRDGKAKMVPGLATGWRATGERTWRLDLRKGVRFHGGEPFDADAVKYSYDRIMDPNQKSPMASSLRLVETVKIVDPYTLEITTRAPAPVLPAYLSLYTNIANRAWLSAQGEAAARTANGTGPFKFIEWKKGDYVKLVRHDAYWGGPAAVRNVTLRPIPDANTRILALRKGEVDIIQEVPPTLADELKREKDLRVSAVPSIRMHYFNFRTDVRPLDDKRVRQALNLAVDKRAIITQILRGFGAPLTQPLTPAMFGYHQDLKGWGYDPARAKSLLREAGFPNGFETEMGGPAPFKDIIEAVGGYLAEVGVRTTIRIEEFNVNYQKLISKKAFPINYATWGNWNLFDADGTVPFLLLPDSQWSYYTPPASVIGLNRIASTTTDPAKRQAAYREILETTHEEAPLLLMHQQYDINAANRKSTWETRGDNVMLLYGAKKA